VLGLDLLLLVLLVLLAAAAAGLPSGSHVLTYESMFRCLLLCLLWCPQDG
jgi:hypothetical protein